ncbi:unnamed protein product, partial [Mesorhabditis belari]|uniref:Ammonium transporter AmtB-like domain-containing protein n=1 Tax=Mesorhabditis belari TaxID=2138241 RepID=A0AAF3FQZ4_9BILA
MDQNLTLQLLALKEEFEDYKEYTSKNIDSFFLCTMALIIFLMQCGFAFLEAGAVRSKNTTNIIFKNVLDSLFALVCYWTCGWGLAYGPGEGFLEHLFGQSEFFLVGTNDYTKFFFQYVFAATAATIVAGAVAERCEIVAYIVYCCSISAVVYPILTHWGWHESGWMAQGFWISDQEKTEYLDFAGSGVVHLCGGTISFIAAYIMGPRIGRFPDDSGEVSGEIKGHSVPFASLGGFILMFGFLAFNGGSTGSITAPGIGKIVSRAMVNTMLSGTMAAFTCLIVHYKMKGKLTLLFTINACLAGMVSAFAVHAGGGSWGLFAACLVSHKGICYAVSNAITGHGWQWLPVAQLFWQIVCAFAIITWSFATMVPVFLLLKKYGKLRVPAEIEIKGLDIYKHGEAAYPLHAYGHGWDEFEPIRTTKKISVLNPEISLEQLASAYDAMSHKKSVYHNPSGFEHPELHGVAKYKKQVPKPTQSGKENGAFNA